jgi:hypothetical protein
MTMAGGERSFDWDALVSRVVHPLKVATVEAMLWIDRPLSSSELTKLFGCQPEVEVGHVAYHVRCLAEAGVLTKVRTRQVRGATQTFYSLRDRGEANECATITISSQQRDALYEQILVGLSGIDAVWLAVNARDYAAAERLGRAYSDDLRLMLDDLGWGEGPTDGAFELTTPPDVLRRVFSRLGDRAASLGAHQNKEQVEAQQLAEHSRLVAEVCQKVLASLDKEQG